MKHYSETNPKKISQELQGHRVLLVDDNEINRKVIGHQLELIGLEVDLASDGFEALQKWQDSSYSLVLTDCHMPEMDGYSLSKHIRNQESNDHPTPIIAITADALVGTREKCINAGMTDYVTKPTKTEILHEKIKIWLQPQLESKQGVDLPEGIDVIKKTSTDFNPDVLAELLGNDDPSLLNSFYREFRDSSFQIASDIKNSQMPGDVHLIADHAHKLKSSARMVGAEALADLCLEIEKAGKERNTQRLDLLLSDFEIVHQETQRWLDTQLEKTAQDR